jgi:serine/threonine protein kinase
MVFQAGQVLNDKYQLQQRLGRTATGHQTWLAVDTSLDLEVTIKLLAFNPQMRWEELKLFEREAQILKTLDHLRIPKYYDYFDLDKEIGNGVPWFALVQQYIPGLSLQEALEQNQHFSEAEIYKIAQQTLDILIYLHQLNPPVLHRDIKPSNLILSQDNNIHLIDFGAVQAQAAVTGVTFTVVGTVGYAPLEQFWGRAVEASDLYALGATIIHLLTGKSPADLPQKDSRLQFRDLVTVKSNFTYWLEKITELSLEKRFQNAVEAKKALTSNNSDDKLFAKESKDSNKRLANQVIYSLINLETSNGQLKIQFPAGGLNRIDEIFNNGCAGLLSYFILFWLVWYLTVFIPSLSYIVLSFLIITITLLLGSKTEILIDRRTGLTIKRKLGTVEYSSQNCPIKLIDNVFVQRTGSIFQVGLQVDYKNYNLGGALNQNEANWIVEEIKNYLEL